MIYIRSILFYVGFVVSTLCVTTLVVVARLLGKRAAWHAAKLWGINANFLLKHVCGIRIRVEGLEHIPDVPCVVVAKHQSTWETTHLPLLLPPFAWVLKKELMYIPLFGWALYALDAIAIRRSNPREALKQVNDLGLKTLKSGRSVVIFPEGTRSAVGVTGNYQPSAMMLAKKAEVAILPVAHNAGICWPKGTMLKYPGTITIRILPPISAADVQERRRADLLDECQSRIEETCRQLEG